MKKIFSYPAVIQQDEAGFYLVTFPDFPECATDSKDLLGAAYEAMDALAEAVAGRINRHEKIPQPSKPEIGQALIPLPAQMAAKAALYLAVTEANTRNTELAHRLRVNEKEIRRLLDPHHKTKLPRMEEALRAMGKRLVVSVEDEDEQQACA